MNNIIIRIYQPEDKKFFFPLMAEFDRYIESIDNLSRLHYGADWPEKVTAQMIRNAEEKNGAIFVAEDEGVIVGFVEGHQQDQSEESLCASGVLKMGRINELFVTEKYRSKHVGKRLMVTIEEYFKTNGFESIFLGVFAPNKSARVFYANLGYIERDVELIKVL